MSIDLFGRWEDVCIVRHSTTAGRGRCVASSGQARRGAALSLAILFVIPSAYFYSWPLSDLLFVGQIRFIIYLRTFAAYGCVPLLFQRFMVSGCKVNKLYSGPCSLWIFLPIFIEGPVFFCIYALLCIIYGGLFGYLQLDLCLKGGFDKQRIIWVLVSVL